MRRLALCVALLAGLVPTTRAQDAEFFAAILICAAGTNDQKIGLSGWNVARSANLRSWRVVADFSNHYGASASDFTPVGSGLHRSD